jgi:hypothetical protein
MHRRSEPGNVRVLSFAADKTSKKIEGSVSAGGKKR